MEENLKLLLDEMSSTSKAIENERSALSLLDKNLHRVNKCLKEDRNRRDEAIRMTARMNSDTKHIEQECDLLEKTLPAIMTSLKSTQEILSQTENGLNQKTGVLQDKQKGYKRSLADFESIISGWNGHPQGNAKQLEGSGDKIENEGVTGNSSAKKLSEDNTTNSIGSDEKLLDQPDMDDDGQMRTIQQELDQRNQQLGECINYIGYLHSVFSKQNRRHQFEDILRSPGILKANEIEIIKAWRDEEAGVA